MSFNVVPTNRFRKEAKRLSQKYPSLKQELAELENVLTQKPETGIPLGNNAFKIRLAIKSKRKGKSGGGRVLTYMISEKQEVYLLTLYDKSEFSTINDKQLRDMIQSLLSELDV